MKTYDEDYDENDNKMNNAIIPLRFIILILAIEMSCNPNVNSKF